MRLKSDQKTCENYQEFFLISKQNQIRGLNFDKKDVIPPIFLPKMGSPLGLDFDAKNGQIFWFDSQQKRIMKSFINGTKKSTILDSMILTEDDSYEAFAIDYTTGNIYFSTCVTEIVDLISETTSDIFVTNLDFYSNVIHQNPRLIKGLVLAPKLGMMYWHDNDPSDFASLNMAKMDGAQPEQFFVFNTKVEIHCLR